MILDVTRVSSPAAEPLDPLIAEIKLGLAKAGPKGLAASVAVGAVITVPYGAPATVTNVGSANAAEFSFEIPEGKPGDDSDMLRSIYDPDGDGKVVSAETADSADQVPWIGIQNPPAFFPPESHTHTAAELDDVSADARSLITAADFAAMRSLLNLESSLFAEQQARLNALNIAELRGDRMNMLDGIVDPYSDASDIAQATGFTLSSGVYSVTSTDVDVTTEAFAISSGHNGSNTASKAFDADENSTSWASHTFGAGTANTLWVGQDFQSARRVRSVKVASGNNDSGTDSLAIQYSDDGVSWITAATGSLSRGLSGGIPNNTTISVGVGIGAHRYWRVLKTNDATGFYWQLADVAMFVPTPAATATLRSAAFASDVANPTLVRLFAQVAPPLNSGAILVNTDLISSVSRDGGTTWSDVALQAVELLADGTTLYEGFADISGQPNGSSMMYRHVTANTKDVRISGTGMQWRV